MNTHDDPKFENFLKPNFMELDMKKFSGPKDLKFWVCGLKTSLGQFGPKVFGKGLIKALAGFDNWRMLHVNVHHMIFDMCTLTLTLIFS